jgi:hypothetical protein
LLHRAIPKRLNSNVCGYELPDVSPATKSGHAFISITSGQPPWFPLVLMRF